MVAECQDPDCSVQDVANVVSGDVGLTFSLLRLANSALYGSRREVTSISEAVNRLGTDRVVRWATLLLMASDADCPTGYIEVALQRARMCELLAIELRPALRESCFLVGLLSVLDSITGMVMDKLLASVPLADNIKLALLHRDGECGKIYSLALSCEAGDWSGVGDSGLDCGTILRAFWQSANFATETAKMLAHVGGRK